MEAWKFVLTYFIILVLFSIIGGEIRFRYLKKHNRNQREEEVEEVVEEILPKDEKKEE